MSQRENTDREYLSRSPPRTQRPPARQRDELERPQNTERQLHADSPTRHDVEFYVRKVNRYQAEIANLEHDLSVAKFRLSKAEDIEIKYDILFRENQKTFADCAEAQEQLDSTRKQLDRIQLELTQANQQVKALKAEVQNEKRSNQDLRQKKEELRTKSTSQGQEEREALKEALNKEIQTLKQDNRQASERFKREISELKSTINMKEVIESALATKLQHIKREKNTEIARLKELVSSLRDQLGQTHNQNESNARQARNDLITETESRIANVRKLAQLIEETMMEEISNLNATLAKKNTEINFLTACDRRQLEEHEQSQKNLKNLIAKLEDKIFVIQRENELELYNTIQRLKKQYEENLERVNEQWEEIRLAHASSVDSLKREISEQKKQIDMLNAENIRWEDRHKELAREQEHSVQMLSQKILLMESERDQSLKQYTTSMRQIEDDAKAKLDDLHTAIQNKTTQCEILNAQMNLKNGEISHLLEEISRLRDINREKLKKLQTTNASEQNALNNEISDLKKKVLELKRNIHELQAKCSDDEAAFQLELQLLKADLQGQKEANQTLISRNQFLAEWCEELDRSLKAERVANVNILHDQSISYRENIQVREEVRVELQARLAKEVEHLKNVHKLEKGRLENELNNRDHELREKKEELGRLLVQYKALEAKMGKSSKVDRSAEDEGKCRATLEAEVLLTQNIFNAINRQ